MLKRVLIPIIATSISPAQAQFWDGPVIDASMHSQAMLNTALTTLNNTMVERAAKEQARKQGKSVSTTSRAARPVTAPAPRAAAISGGYRPDPAVRRKLADIMSKKAAESGAAQEAQMRQLVLSGEAVRQYEKIAPGLGLRANDAIDGLTFYLLSQWGVANNHRAMFTPAQVAGVRRQAIASFAGVADQVNTDALRQEFGEMLMVQGAIMSGVFETAVNAGDNTAAARYAALARAGGKSVFTVDPTQVALTDSGFRRK